MDFLRQLSVYLNENSRVLHLREEILKQMAGWSNSQVQLMEWHNGAIRRILTDHAHISSLHNLDALVAFETLAPSPACPTIDIPIIQVPDAASSALLLNPHSIDTTMNMKRSHRPDPIDLFFLVQDRPFCCGERGGGGGGRGQELHLMDSIVDAGY